MKANWKRTLLSLVLCAGFVWPAGAVSTGQPAAPQTGTSTTQSKPAAYTVKKMGLLGVKRTVESDNNTVKMLNKTAASLDSSSYMSGSTSSATGESEIAIYAALIEDMKKAMDGLDKTSDLYKTYAVQLKVLEDYQTSLNQNAVSGMQQAMAMLSQLDDAAYTLRKQAKNGAFVPGSNEKQAQMRRSLNEAESRMQPQREEKQRPEPTRAIRVGDTVELLKLGTKASVLAINKDGSYQLRAGIMQITAKPEEVYLLENETQNAAKKVIAGKVRELKAAAQPELDIRGMAVDEALPVLDNFLDAAYMGNLPNARIIHGKGTGVLRAAVQEELRRCKYVKSFRLGVYGEGESGVTIVEFK